MDPDRDLRKLPKAFQSLRSLRVLNVAAMAFSLAAATGGAFGHLLGQDSYDVRTFGAFGVHAALPTFVVGLVWALLLRTRATVGASKLRWGWLLSLPLAAANGALATGILGATTGHDAPLPAFFLGAAFGATVGAICWIPGLVATLAVFGFPVAWAQKLADEGLAGEERGERIVGIASTLLASAGMAMTIHGADGTHGAFGYVGLALLYFFATAGIGSGVAATVLAQRREGRRRRFVDDAAAGKIRGYRVDAVPEGKVLVRVASMGHGYRVADIEEEIYALDDRGAAKGAAWGMRRERLPPPVR